MLAKDRIIILNSEAAARENEAKQMREEVAQLIKSCKHLWDNKEGAYVPIYEKGYMIPGDPPGVGGSDHRSDFYVESKTTPQWQRTCQFCGHVQKTQHKKMTGGALKQEVPDFGD